MSYKPYKNGPWTLNQSKIQIIYARILIKNNYHTLIGSHKFRKSCNKTLKYETKNKSIMENIQN